jgi:hypothetical protein
MVGFTRQNGWIKFQFSQTWLYRQGLKQRNTGFITWWSNRDYLCKTYISSTSSEFIKVFLLLCINSMSHSFEDKTFTHLTYCDYCKRLLWGVAKQGVQCKGNFWYCRRFTKAHKYLFKSAAILVIENVKVQHQIVLLHNLNTF